VSETRCGFVALIGAPNAGKSTLINALVGEKVSIVTRKAQTTRSTVRGVLTRGEAQIVFVDTPGLFAPKRRLDRAMVASAWGAAADADVLALLIDSRKEAGHAAVTEETSAILKSLSERGKPKLIVLNKIDLVERPKLLELAARLNAALAFDDTFMISAATGDGLDRLTARLVELVAPGPWLYPEDQIAEAPIRSLAAEITREKLIERLHDELPYQTTVETDSWKDLPDGSARIEHRRSPRRERASLPAREGARALARRPRALSRDGSGVPEGVGRYAPGWPWPAQ
jgi:GTP-binding protein Era